MSFNHTLVYKVPEKFRPKNPEWGKEGACCYCKNALRAETGYICKRTLEDRSLTDKGFYGCGYIEGLPTGDKEKKKTNKEKRK